MYRHTRASHSQQRPPKTQYMVRLDKAALARDIPLDNGRYTLVPTQDLGTLQQSLPTELIQQILLMLDLPMLTVFRRINQQAMAMVDSISEYNMIYRNCPNVLRAILAVDARAFSLADLYTSLRQERCCSCKDAYGTQIYLITGVRICTTCAFTNDDYFGTSLDGVKLALGVGFGASRYASSISTIPHIKNLHDQPVPDSALVYDVDTVKQIRINVHMNLVLDKPLSKLFVEAPLGLPGEDADWMNSYCEECRRPDPWSKTARQRYTRRALVDHLQSYHTGNNKSGIVHESSEQSSEPDSINNQTSVTFDPGAESWSW